MAKFFRADSFLLTACPDPACKCVHLIAKDDPGSWVCDVPLTLKQIDELREVAKDLMYSKAVLQDGP